MGMSLTVKLTAALWAALTDINADHRQSKLQYPTTSFHDQVIATSMLPPDTAACGTPNSHPIVHEKEEKKIWPCCSKKKKMMLMREAKAQAQQPSPRLLSPCTVVPSVRVVVSTVPAACPLRPLDAQFWLTL